MRAEVSLDGIERAERNNSSIAQCVDWTADPVGLQIFTGPRHLRRVWPNE